MDVQGDIDWCNTYTKINVKQSTKAKLLEYRKDENERIKNPRKHLQGLNTTIEHLLEKVRQLEGKKKGE